MLRGNIQAKVDEKGRVKIPGAYLAELRESGDKFYITSQNGDHARLYPMKEWDLLEEKIARAPSKTRLKFMARWNYYGQEVELDTQGRVVIPPVLREAAQVNGQVDVMGFRTHLQIWNHDRLTVDMERNPITPHDEDVADDLGI
jgi:MraZ protein